jgi:hypothetical protein
VGVRSDGSQ